MRNPAIQLFLGAALLAGLLGLILLPPRQTVNAGPAPRSVTVTASDRTALPTRVTVFPSHRLCRRGIGRWLVTVARSDGTVLLSRRMTGRPVRFWLAPGQRCHISVQPLHHPLNDLHNSTSQTWHFRVRDVISLVSGAIVCYNV